MLHGAKHWLNENSIKLVAKVSWHTVIP